MGEAPKHCSKEAQLSDEASAFHYLKRQKTECVIVLMKFLESYLLHKVLNYL